MRFNPVKVFSLVRAYFSGFLTIAFYFKADVFMLSATIVTASRNSICEPQTAANMNKHEDRELSMYIELSVEILKTQDRKAIEFLKNFLAILPSLTEISMVLTAAIEQLAQTDPESCRWILRNPRELMPELDLLSLGQQVLRSQLKTERILPKTDFFFDENARMVLRKEIKERLMTNSNKAESLILEEMISTFERADK
ncbi:hypothetical protein IQ235_03345 [Oscillatoriales cyanobacterium LEGE 11467]|uniref:Uncharacterized protein n=1 Tax=Zarconia navalis LEGE 11467 TaxID=1828826 RepID=A0A928VW47_9CYAN|nr:hypothetical protein [Zarconia navalis]MBE9039827.1 hypothetical protein [Zarconia navalis LEGE 11467]